MRELSGWLAVELERLQLQFSTPDAGHCLADGGTLMPDLMNTPRRSRIWDRSAGGNISGGVIFRLCPNCEETGCGKTH